ncbi:MAG TPA: hypothetical protein VN088_06115 [Nocardioides sp.]|nr:hypothetical protein [Nocardioides sp.]
MSSTWTVTAPERDQVLGDAFRAQMAAGQALILYAYLGVVIVVMAIAGGVPAALGGLILSLACVGVVAGLWRRQLRRGLTTAYPDGFVAESELVGDRLRLVDAVATTEIGLQHLRKPRVVGTAVSVIKPGARFRRLFLPRVLVADEVLARLS